MTAKWVRACPRGECRFCSACPLCSLDLECQGPVKPSRKLKAKVFGRIREEYVSQPDGFTGHFTAPHVDGSLIRDEPIVVKGKRAVATRSVRNGALPDNLHQ